MHAKLRQISALRLIEVAGDGGRAGRLPVFKGREECSELAARVDFEGEGFPLRKGIFLSSDPLHIY